MVYSFRGKSLYNRRASDLPLAGLDEPDPKPSEGMEATCISFSSWTRLPHKHFILKELHDQVGTHNMDLYIKIVLQFKHLSWNCMSALTGQNEDKFTENDSWGFCKHCF